MVHEIKNFYDLDAWKRGHHLVLKIYKMTQTFPGSEKYGLVSQLQRAASSITANIAEGFERYHFKDKIRFYYQSRGSIAEVINFFILSKDLGYLSIELYQELEKVAVEVRQLVNGLIRSIEKQM